MSDYPILFRGDTTDFTTNGMGRLTDCISSYVTEALNGGYEAVVTYPKNGKHAEDIRQKRFLYIKPNETSDRQAFRIYKIEETSDGQRMVVRCQHRSYDLSGYPVKPFTATGITSSLQGLVTNSLVTNPYSTWKSDDLTNETTKFSLAEPRSFRACLGGVEGSFLQMFKCELEFDNLTVKLWKTRGEDNGVTIRYGKNLEKFTNVRTTESAYSGCIAFWKDSEGKKVVYGDVQKATTAVDDGGTNLNFPTSRIFVLDASSDVGEDFEKKTATEKKAILNNRANEYMDDNNFGVPYLDTVTVSFVPLWQTEEYKEVAVLEQVALGDYVHVIYGRFNFTTRVVEYTYDSIKGRYTSITLGTKQATFSSTIQNVTSPTSISTSDTISQAITEFSQNAQFEEGITIVDGAKSMRIGIKPTGTYSNTFAVNGFVTSGGKTVVLYVPLLTALMSITVNKLTGSIRHVGGGYIGSAENVNLKSYLTDCTYLANQNMLRMYLTNNNGWGVTNNTPVSGTISMGYTVLTSDYYRGKKISILGDSISTYVGYVPTGQSAFYTGSNCGVTSVNQTWWMRIINTLGMTLELNNSWGGSRVSNTNGTNSSGITRASLLGTSPDVIIVYMGINDFNNEVSTTDFADAYETMIDNILTAYPDADVFCATLPPCERNGTTGDPEINDDGVYLSEYNQIIQDAVEAKGVKLVDFAGCGITYATLYRYMGDWDDSTGRALHPNAEGMALIAEQAIQNMLE